MTFVACNSNIFYEQNHSFEDGKWLYDEAADFSFSVPDTVAHYDLVLEVIHDPSFTYENIYVKIHTTFPAGNKITDEVSLQLADHLDQWEGKCKGKKCKVNLLLQSDVYFKAAGEHKISIEQYNRVDPLEKINGLTLKILSLP